METIALNAEDSRKAIRILEDEVKELRVVMTQAKDLFKGAHDQTNIGFLNSISESYEKMESLMLSLGNVVSDISYAMEAYIRQVGEYEQA